MFFLMGPPNLVSPKVQKDGTCWGRGAELTGTQGKVAAFQTSEEQLEAEKADLRRRRGGGGWSFDTGYTWEA